MKTENVIANSLENLERYVRENNFSGYDYHFTGNCPYPDFSNGQIKTEFTYRNSANSTRDILGANQRK